VGPELLAHAPEELAADDELAVGPPLQRLPAVDEVEVLELCPRVGRDAVEPAAVTRADLDVVVVAEVAVDAVLRVPRELARRGRVEEVVDVAGEDLSVDLGERVAGQLDQLGDRGARVRPPLLAPEQVDDGERLVRPRQHVEVQRVDLSELGLELPGLHDEVPGEVEERDVALLDVDALVREREEQVGARVRVDDRLERDLRLLELERLGRHDGVVPGRREEVADDRDRGVEERRVDGVRREHVGQRSGRRRLGRRRRRGSRLRGRRRLCRRGGDG
jgi:hypothetical protein